MQIINDVLDFSKSESGKLELNTEELDLYKLTNQVIDLFIYQADLKKIELILNVDKKCTAIYHSRFCQIKTSKC
jgi:signal transduction histidine kinase